MGKRVGITKGNRGRQEEGGDELMERVERDVNEAGRGFVRLHMNWEVTRHMMICEEHKLLTATDLQVEFLVVLERVDEVLQAPSVQVSLRQTRKYETR